MVMIVKNVKMHTSVQILIFYPVWLLVRKDLEFHSFKNWRIMKINFRKAKFTIAGKRELDDLNLCNISYGSFEELGDYQVEWLPSFIGTGISFNGICFINGVCIVDGYIKSQNSPAKSPAMIRKSFHIHRFNWYFEHILSKFK